MELRDRLQATEVTRAHCYVNNFVSLRDCNNVFTKNDTKCTAVDLI